MLARVDLATIDDLANIEAILKDMGQWTDHEVLGGNDPAVRQFSSFWLDAFLSSDAASLPIEPSRR